MTLSKLRAARLKANITMEEMGNQLNISRPAYWKIEHGKTKLSFANAVKISQILKMDVNSLFLNSELTKPEHNGKKDGEAIK
ncbi:helix-turn-helix domain-containing protein [Lentilactobacillus buchneri]|uniref:HTH cro/C1-type domain-containing protein n=1 Tax=Lentilactobacillus buchneri DSM 20057 TaxID=1423728 RepID=A0A4R5NPZ5_LENBU|nr:helix-turn-helix transcriptional regulator [Lentilactobacillus buchneri]MCT3253463.1 XRE family transcriptional regulator [Lentilactobacillus buchneri]MCT3548055.1 XRE family transcriptional regulator [Lentilactobacillus buchneri]MCT4438523.1 XRE family transcriptional regulator [Lentilactobacillus buchneri]MQM69558.1 helix-turn-helix transcriptional regulator [Lentilactobacillus buchneri]QUX05605.1 helix-turn-helix transcriptional regulator [Lentilactobacillus buchneri]